MTDLGERLELFSHGPVSVGLLHDADGGPDEIGIRVGDVILGLDVEAAMLLADELRLTVATIDSHRHDDA